MTFFWFLYKGQIYGGDFAKLCGLLRIYELYWVFQKKSFFPNENQLGFHMRFHLFLHYKWFLQNLRKYFIRTNMNTTVPTKASFCSIMQFLSPKLIMFRYSEKATEFKHVFNLFLKLLINVKIKWVIFFKFLWPSLNI